LIAFVIYKFHKKRVNDKEAEHENEFNEEIPSTTAPLLSTTSRRGKLTWFERVWILDTTEKIFLDENHNQKIN
jgi:hypothetical protein